MKSIHTLVPDIYNMVGGPNGLSESIASDMASSITSALQGAFGKQQRRGLRLSGLGNKCPCALWYEVNHPELAEPLPPYAKIKYAYGHIVEHMLIGLAKAAGHTVEGEQHEIVCDGIVGHRDAVVDGCVVDFKSAATRSFLKFKTGTIAQDDPFGYLDQIDGYVCGSSDDPLVVVKDKGYLVAIDKQLGHLALYEHTARPRSIRDRISKYKEIVSRAVAPACQCGTETDGESGNIKLDTRASYNSYKYCCHPKLRTFLYSDGPRYLVTVAKRPVYRGQPITEVDKHGNLV